MEILKIFHKIEWMLFSPLILCNWVDSQMSYETLLNMSSLKQWYGII